MFSGKSVEKHAFFLLIDRIKGKEGGIHYIIYISGRRGSWGWLDLLVLQILWVWWVLQGVVSVAGIIHRNKKKVFFLFLPSHPHKCGSSALFIGGSRVRVSVRVELLPSHLPSHYPHTTLTLQSSELKKPSFLIEVPAVGRVSCCCFP